MISNYFKVAIRSILKHKFFAAINIIGLVIGVTSCMLIFIYVQDELSFDRFHRDYQNIYRVGLQAKVAGQEIMVPNTCTPLGPAMKSEITGIDEYVRLFPPAGGTRMAFRYEEQSNMEDDVYYVDSNFFTFFSFELVKGNPETVLSDPNNVVLSEQIAAKYFGNEDPLGKTLILGNDKLACKVTGIMKYAPSNSHVHFNALISFATVEKKYSSQWVGNGMFTYVRKNPSANVKDIETGLDGLVSKYVASEIEKGLGFSFDQFIKQGGIYRYFLFPIADSHLHANFREDIEPSGNVDNVYIFAGVGLFILLIACINFMNLATAQSAGRAKEVGLRKTLGSQRRQMIGQFLSESFVYSLVAVLIALGLSFVLLPYFNTLTGKALEFGSLLSPRFFVVAAVLVILVGFIAGSYPALYLTSFNAVEVLKGKVRAGLRSKGVRSSLVVFQFAVSTFLIIATGVVFDQLKFMQSRDLGIDSQHVIQITGLSRLGTNIEAFRNSVDGMAGVEKSSFTDNVFPGMNNTTVVRAKGKEVDHMTGLYYSDWDHLHVMGMKMKDGRFFSREFKSDTAAVILNEAAVKEFGFEEPIGAEVVTFERGAPATLRVVGVVSDFNFESLKSNVRPVVICFRERSRVLMIRYEGDPSTVVKQLEAQWKELAPGEPLEYSFLDQRFDGLFRAEMRMRDIFTIFAVLAIFIACLGLFALAAFTTEQRTKEIGVRKALGASAFSLTLLLSKEFTRLVLIAIVPAIAAGWYVANWWLQDFPYRVELSPLLFVGSGFAAIAIAWLTVSYQSVKAASANPVGSLRYE